MIKQAVSILVLFSSLSYANSNQKKIAEILDLADKQYRSESGHTVVEMQIKTENWDRTMKLEMWSKGTKKTLITIKMPKKDAGITTLRINKSMWNYFPKINKVIKIPPSMMMGSWMGSDFTNDDLVKETTFLEDYRAKMIDGSSNEKYYIELRPKESTTSVWDKILLTINKKTSILEKQVSFDERGEKVRTMSFTEVKKLGGKLIPTLMTITSHKKEGNQTILRYLSAEFDHIIKDDFFSKRNLQKRR